MEVGTMKIKIEVEEVDSEQVLLSTLCEMLKQARETSRVYLALEIIDRIILIEGYSLRQRAAN